MGILKRHVSRPCAWDKGATRGYASGYLVRELVEQTGQWMGKARPMRQRAKCRRQAADGQRTAHGANRSACFLPRSERRCPIVHQRPPAGNLRRIVPVALTATTSSTTTSPKVGRVQLDPPVLAPTGGIS